MSEHTTLMDLLRRQADRYRDKEAFSFSYNGDDEGAVVLTFADPNDMPRFADGELASLLDELEATAKRVLHSVSARRAARRN